MSRIAPLLVILAVLLAVAAAVRADEVKLPAEGVEFFERKIRPVLVEHCYGCHSAKAKNLRGGLRLDSRPGVLRGGDSGPAIAPGKPGESLLLEALRHESFEMPPEGKLSDATIADFEKWVAMGAPDPRDEPPGATGPKNDTVAGEELWSLRPRRDPAIPVVGDPTWPHNEIDHFILARLEDAGLAPAEDADRGTLLRRAWFTLVGLPPAPEEIEAFAADRSPDAFERLVDRLLASPAFGQRFGRHWLDVARFAESSGGGRTAIFPQAWRYRDWAIDALNEDKPYDAFIVEQIAGDLLKGGSLEARRERLTATGFLALGPTNYELQDKELLRMEVIDEQLDTIGRAFLGLTIGCARCHDHKFDPIPTRDYYALAGIFRSTKTLTPGNVSGWVQRPLPMDSERTAALAEHRRREKELEDGIEQAEARQKSLEGQLAQLRGGAGGIVVDDEAAQFVGQWRKSTHTKPFVGVGYRHDNNEGRGQKSATFRARLPGEGRYRVRLAYTPGTNRNSTAHVEIRHGGTSLGTRQVDQRKKPPAGAYVDLGEFDFGGQGLAEVVVSNAGGDGHTIADAVMFVPLDGQSAPDAERQRRIAELDAELKTVGQDLKRLAAERKALEKSAPPPAPQVMSVLEENEQGDYYICIRGNARSLGEQVPRGFLSAIDGPEAAAVPSDASGRLELARWIASEENPLTARVAVNRVWKHLFGEGIVRTPDNFGAMGQRPSHPELLDWLATRFVEDGWSVKRLARRIVLSRTWRQSAQRRFGAVVGAIAADPENRLLAGAHRRRLEAEALRDAMLTFCGELDPRFGGPTIRAGLRSEFGYEFRSLRRGVYVPAFRNTLEGLFEVFDFADPNLVSGHRNSSTLPTQALYLMNSRFVAQRSRAAAERLLEADLDDGDRVRLAYLQTLGRPPRPDELQLTLDYLSAAGSPDARLRRFAGFCQSLIACVDFRYLD